MEPSLSRRAALRACLLSTDVRRVQHWGLQVYRSHNFASVRKLMLLMMATTDGDVLNVEGTMLFGEATDHNTAMELLTICMDHGVNFFDSAEMYPVPQREDTHGMSERYLGDWLKQQRRLQPNAPHHVSCRCRRQFARNTCSAWRAPSVHALGSAQYWHQCEANLP